MRSVTLLRLSLAALVPRVAGALASPPTTTLSRPAPTPRSSVALQYGGYDVPLGYEPGYDPGYDPGLQQGYGGPEQGYAYRIEVRD